MSVKKTCIRILVVMFLKLAEFVKCSVNIEVANVNNISRRRRVASTPTVQEHMFSHLLPDSSVFILQTFLVFCLFFNKNNKLNANCRISQSLSRYNKTQDELFL